MIEKVFFECDNLCLVQWLAAPLGHAPSAGTIQAIRYAFHLALGYGAREVICESDCQEHRVTGLVESDIIK